MLFIVRLKNARQVISVKAQETTSVFVNTIAVSHRARMVRLLIMTTARVAPTAHVFPTMVRQQLNLNATSIVRITLSVNGELIMMPANAYTQIVLQQCQQQQVDDRKGRSCVLLELAGSINSLAKL